MYAAIYKSSLKGTIQAIPSKSFAHRITICAALCKEPTQVIGKLDSEDFIVTRTCLERLGVRFEENERGYLITPTDKFSSNVLLNCGESGSSLRFLLPVVAALDVNATFEGKSGLQARPIVDLIDTLRLAGVSISNDILPFSLSGHINTNTFKLRGDISSQYISGMLLALPLLKQDSEIIIVGELSSKSYIDITLDVMKRFGVDVKVTDSGYIIEANQEYISPKTIKVEGDWSNSACWLVAGAVSGDITVEGLNLASTQGDKLVVDILKDMGAGVILEKDSVRVYKRKLKGVTFDADNTPDLVPIISIAAACADKITVINSVERLRIKESDRLATVMDMLKRLGIKSAYDGALKILGGDMQKAVLYGYNDHRLIMAATVAATVTGDSIIMGIDAVKKSYPNFFEDYTKLGGKFDVLFEQ